MIRRALLLAFGLAAFASPLYAEPVAELAVHVARADLKQEVAHVVVDSVYSVQAGSSRKVNVLNMTCEGIQEAGNWAAAVQPGDTLVFALVKQNGWRLTPPEKGLVLTCKCTCSKRPRTAHLTALFVTPSGLSSQLKSHGWIAKSWPAAIRIRIGWDQDLSVWRMPPEPPRDGRGRCS